MPKEGSSRTEYDFLEKIGDGAFGQVYRAQHKTNRQIVAIKTVKHRPSEHIDDATDYSLREYRALRMLDRHPNIVQLYQSFIASADELHLVMEYVNGGNLLQYMQHRRDTNNPLEHNEIRRIFRQVMHALEYIHRENVFHRDMKPENILIANSPGESSSVIKLADFGLARPINGKGPLTEYISTRWYRAPEVLLRSRHYSSPVDIWAAGTILAELITLSPLFPGNTQIDQIYRICAVLGSPGKPALFSRNRSGSKPEQRSSPGFASKAKAAAKNYPQCVDPDNQWREGLKLAQRMGFQFPNVVPKTLQGVLPTASASMLDLLRKLLYYDPDRRLTASEALQHLFFQEDKRRTRLHDELQREFPKRARKEYIEAVDLLTIPTAPLQVCPDWDGLYPPRRQQQHEIPFSLDSVAHYGKHLVTWATNTPYHHHHHHLNHHSGNAMRSDMYSDSDDGCDYNRLNGGWPWLKVL